MSTRKMLSGIVVCLIVIVALAVMTDVVTHAEGQGVDESSVLAKLDEILNGQKAIMADIAAMREELRVIKIRVTQQQ